MLINQIRLDAEVESGFISRRKHPDLPLYIYNYTPECVYSNHWNDLTRLCRGLILDEDYNVVARPFEKFFNLNTESELSTRVDKLPDVAPLVTEKMDGSLGILWRWHGHEGIATRGSFDSEQARWATAHWNTITKLLRWKFDFQWNVTPLFEIIYPENRIVVDYHGESKLTLLGVVRNADGSEYTYEEMENTFYPDIVKVYAGKSLSDCVAESETDVPLNTEGYVLRYDTGKRPPLRIKIKFVDYIRLHKIMFSLSTKSIWELAKSGTNPDEVFFRLPDDARIWATNKYNELQQLFHSYVSQTLEIFNNKPTGSRKDMAMYFKQWPEMQSICFSLLDKKDASMVIWKKLEPERADFFRRISNEEL
jgi:hypothetical protein